MIITPLKPHHGHRGGLVALGVLVAAITVVWLTDRTDEPARHRTRASAAVSAIPKRITDGEPPATLARAPGLETFVVEERVLRSHVTGTGTTEYDAARTSFVGTPVAGFLTKQRASTVGRKVRAGEVLGVVYSAEVFAATAELAEHIRDFRSQRELDQVRYRILAWGMPRQTLSRIEKLRAPYPILPLAAGVPGIVVEEQALPRQFVEAGGEVLFTVTDPAYSSVFVDVPNVDAARITVGTSARLTIEGVKKPIVAKVAYVFRRGEEGMRKVRFDIHSPKVRIAPHQPATAELDLPAGRAVVIPESAVLHAGARTLVYVARGDVVEARDLKVEAAEPGFYRVIEGLAAGDTVARRVADLR